jgi:predicted flap endonuclease-1-like 5' DNA nuclease
MNPIIVIVVFVSVLAALLYYLQGRESDSESEPSGKQDKKIVKVDDYQAQYEKETGKTEEKEPKEEAVDEDDISQLDGVGPKYQELLRAAGYNKIQDILETTPEMLFEELNKVNIEKEITKRPPALNNVEAWIEAAKNS